MPRQAMARWRGRIKPTASAVPASITAAPASICGVTDSPSHSPPQSTANSGATKVTAIARPAPTLAISRKYRM